MLHILSGDIETNPGPVKSKNIRICHVNIRSLSRSKLLAIKSSLTNLYDVITISESHLHAGVPNNVFTLEGFHEIIRKDRVGQGGGVAVFICESIVYKQIFKYEKLHLETIWLQVHSIEGKVLICCCYRPSDKGSFWKDFSHVLDEVKNDQVNNLFIIGDLNADFKTTNGRELLQLCNYQNLICLVKEPTRITNTSATILDQAITNAPNFVKEVQVSPPVSTNDHCTIGIHLHFKIIKEPAYQRTVWLYKNTDFKEFKNALNAQDFSHCFDSDDVDSCSRKWTETFLNVARAHVPNKLVTIRPSDSPWYTSELRTLKRKMLRSFHKYKKQNNDNNWSQYKTLRNNYQKQLDQAEITYKQALASSLKLQRNTKQWWQVVKWLLGKGGDTSYPSLLVDNKVVATNKEKADVFNNFFLSHSNIDFSNASLPDEDNFPEGLGFIEASEEEVHDLLKSIDPSKSTGPDGISPRLLREAGIAIVPSLTKLFNVSLSSSKVPSSWKLANVIPLFKKGEKSSANNYRPVSLLSCISKILERIVFKHVFNYLRDINFISEHQSGFQPGDSTVNQLTYLYHMFADGLDKKKNIHIVFCDVKKASDRVFHDGLLFKLRKAGIYGTLLNWFKNYLADRYQQVIIQGQCSVPGHIKAGVPQGSVLGPLLFLIYMNDITNVTNCNIKLFADDTSLFIEFDKNTNVENTLNEDLSQIQEWANQWLVRFSPSKSKLLTCSFRKLPVADITFNNTNLESVESHKHLGLILSNDLSWTKHIESIVKSVSPLIDVLKKLKYDLDRTTLETTYFSFIRPKMEYGCQIWDNCSNRDSDMLENLQLDIARIVTGARKGTSHDLIYSETNWQTLSKRRELFKLKHFIKIVNNEAPEYLKSLLPMSHGMVRPNSRNPDNYFIFKSRTETFKSSFMPSSIVLSNETTSEHRNVDFITQSMKHKGNNLFNYGNRTEGIKHAQLRMLCSKLNAHLFSLHVVDSPQCPCGYVLEDNHHYLLQCPLFNIPRQNLLQVLNNLIEAVDINTTTLLYGSEKYDLNINQNIFLCVHEFIRKSSRL